MKTTKRSQKKEQKNQKGALLSGRRDDTINQEGRDTEMTNNTNTDLTTFAKNVQTVANANASTEFYGADRAFISAVYDAYGRDFDDAGSLASFHERLVAAHTARLITLQRCDNVRLMDDDKRARSTISIDGMFDFHTIAVVD